MTCCSTCPFWAPSEQAEGAYCIAPESDGVVVSDYDREIPESCPLRSGNLIVALVGGEIVVAVDRAS